MFRETSNGCFVGSKGRGRPFCGSMRSVRPTGRTDCAKHVRSAWFCGFSNGTVSRRSSQHLGGAGVSPVTKPISGRPLDPIPKRGFKGVGLKENFNRKAPSIADVRCIGGCCCLNMTGAKKMLLGQLGCGRGSGCIWSCKPTVRCGKSHHL